MSFGDFPDQKDPIQLLKRSLGRGRLGHAYLFCGVDLEQLEAVAVTLAKTLNCERPPERSASGLPVDCCDACLTCRKIQGENHPDVQFIRPESKSRIITIEQMRELMQTIHLKPTQAEFKVAIIRSADRLNIHAANAFLKTLEEPPSNSILILLTTEPQRILETILSRCLRLSFSGETGRYQEPGFLKWLEEFSQVARSNERSLLARYRLLSVLLSRLNALRDGITEKLTERSPLQRYEDAEPKLRDKWEDELAAAIEAEYRRQRADLLTGLHWWLRDIWVQTLKLGPELLTFGCVAGEVEAIGRRVSEDQAMENLQVMEQTQRLLTTNVQEALALEVGLLKLHL